MKSGIDLSPGQSKSLAVWENMVETILGVGVRLTRVMACVFGRFQRGRVYISALAGSWRPPKAKDWPALAVFYHVIGC